jgi:hypothetical protein
VWLIFIYFLIQHGKKRKQDHVDRLKERKRKIEAAQKSGEI